MPPLVVSGAANLDKETEPPHRIVVGVSRDEPSAHLFVSRAKYTAALSQDLTIHPQLTVLSTEPLELGPLIHVERTAPFGLTSLFHPRGERTIRDPKRSRHLLPGPIRRSIQLDGFSPELFPVPAGMTHPGLLPLRLAPRSDVQKTGSTPFLARGKDISQQMVEIPH